MNNLRIAEERKKLGLSQEELANKLKISQKSVSKYERGTRRPSYETLLAMANIFGVSADYLLGNSTENNTDEQSEPEYTTRKERQLLNIYRKYEDNGFGPELEAEIREFFPEMQKKLEPSEDKILTTFRSLNVDNQDIIIGKAKELLKEQLLYTETPVAAGERRKLPLK